MDCCNWILYVHLHNCVISIDIYSPVNKFYSVIIFFSLLIKAVILLLNCLVLILHFYINFLSFKTLFSLLKHYLDLYIIDTALKISRSLYCSLLLYLMVLKTISPGCWVRASLMLFFTVLMLQIALNAWPAQIMLFELVSLQSSRTSLYCVRCLITHAKPQQRINSAQ